MFSSKNDTSQLRINKIVAKILFMQKHKEKLNTKFKREYAFREQNEYKKNSREQTEWM